jgi:hypothetical protein
MEDGIRLIDNGPVPVFYVDDYGSLEILGSNATILFVRYRILQGEKIAEPVVEIVRPVAGCGQGKLRDLLRRKVAMRPDAALLLPLH